MRVVLFGANGQLGTDILKESSRLGYETYPLTLEDARIEKPEEVEAVLARIRPEIIINASAYTNVPGCETSLGDCFGVNAYGALHIAQQARKLDCINIYFSTDYVFDGRKGSPYFETDSPNPVNAYGISKLAGELFTLNYSPNSLVIRVSGIYGVTPSMGKGTNFIYSILKVAKEKGLVSVVDDEFLSPAPTPLLAERLFDIIRAGETGVFHLGPSQGCSWFQFASVVFRELGVTAELKKASAKDFPSVVQRPANSMLAMKRYQTLPAVRALPDWEEALVYFLTTNTLNV